MPNALQVVLSGSGTAARLISKYRPPCPIVAVSDNDQVLRGLAGYYGIVPCKVRRMACVSVLCRNICYVMCVPAGALQYFVAVCLVYALDNISGTPRTASIVCCQAVRGPGCYDAMF
jgi:hypothetical protein